jgi:hypothetical protein
VVIIKFEDASEDLTEQSGLIKFPKCAHTLRLVHSKLSVIHESHCYFNSSKKITDQPANMECKKKSAHISSFSAIRRDDIIYWTKSSINNGLRGKAELRSQNLKCNIREGLTEI